MSATYTCTDCHHLIPAGEAVIRSRSFQRVTLHKDCAEESGIQTARLADLVPLQAAS